MQYEIGSRAHRISDINGDEFDDYLLTGQYGIRVGMAFIYLGSSQGMESYPVATAYNPQSGEILAMEAIGIPDIDGDGYGDFVANFVTFGETGFVVFGGKAWRRTPVDNVPVPATPAMTVFPNPFTEFVTIVASGSVKNSSSLMVHDVYGRDIRRIPVSGNLGTETRTFWDGRDSRGAKVPPGMYYCILETTDGFLKARIIKQ
ncbi:MAG: T9SS type A sorting domain-containing protein [Ignavibacteria bacterium]|nr:T9SS type A sorting domain-containing protein [Ignavibacteria bacterium]